MSGVDLIFRNLPANYRKAGKYTTTFALTATLAQTLKVLEQDSQKVMSSRFVEYLTDLADARRLAALFEIEPWPWEELEDFRYRLQTTAKVFLQGSANIYSILHLVGAAFAAELKEASIILPGEGSNDLYTTTAAFYLRKSPDTSFETEVIDAPLVPKTLAVTWLERFRWEVLSWEPADPVIDIVAGATPIFAPILLHSDSGKFVLINRVIPPQTTLTVDFSQGLISPDVGMENRQIPILLGGQPAPDLIWGTGGQLNWPGANGTLPQQLLSWSRIYPNHPRPPLLPFGLSNWQLLRSFQADAAGEFPEALSLEQVRPAPFRTGCPQQLLFHWTPHQFGSFTINMPEVNLAKEIDRHRFQWIYHQLQKLVPAGIKIDLPLVKEVKP